VGGHRLVGRRRGWRRRKPRRAKTRLRLAPTLFNVFAMRRGTLIVGERGDSLMCDLVRMPGLIVSFGSTLAAAGRRTAVGACQLVIRRPLRGA
jgi:hypothetical protein